MSFFDDASLVMIPSGYKDQKVYSVKPTDGTGDLTFSRASSATRVQSNGLIEKVRTNAVLYSEQLNNAAAWGFEQLAVTANAVANPLDGAVTADKIYATVTGASVPILKQSIGATANQTITVSGYFKKLEYDYVLIHGFGLGGTSFNLAAGTKSGTGTITSVGNGWYRCAAVLAMTGDARIFITPSVDGSVSYVSTANSGIYAFGVQVEINDIATDYIATTTAAVSVGPVSGLPRLDYLGSTCPRLLLEPQRTNLVLYSEQLDNAGWNKSNVTITANNIVSPDGYTNADLATATAGGELNQYVALSTSTAYTFSFYVKKGTAADAKYRVYNFDAGVNVVAPTSYISQTNTSTWVRVSVSFTSSATGTNYGIYLLDGASAGTMYFWGAQLEAGAYATSYIPTLGASVTRVADAASKTGITSLIGQTEGTLFADVNLDTRAQFTYFTISPNLTLSSNYIGFLIGSTSIAFEVVTGSALQSSITLSNSATGRFKIAASYKNNDFAFYINGVQVGTATSGTVPACSAMGFYEFAQVPTVKYNQALLFKTRLSNAQLAEITAL